MEPANIELVDIGLVYDDPRRLITVTDGKTAEKVVATLTYSGDYKREWTFTAFGQKKVMYSELRNEPGQGTCLCWGIR